MSGTFMCAMGSAVATGFLYRAIANSDDGLIALDAAALVFFLLSFIHFQIEETNADGVDGDGGLGKD